MYMVRHNRTGKWLTEAIQSPGSFNEDRHLTDKPTRAWTIQNKSGLGSHLSYCINFYRKFASEFSFIEYKMVENGSVSVHEAIDAHDERTKKKDAERKRQRVESAEMEIVALEDRIRDLRRITKEK